MPRIIKTESDKELYITCPSCMATVAYCFSDIGHAPDFFFENPKDYILCPNERCNFQINLEDWFEGCEIMTPKKVKDRLENIERELAKQLNLPEYNIRNVLIKMDQDNKLIETDLVADWHCAYATYYND